MSQQTADSAADTDRPGGRDVFIVSNSVDELGGVTTWSHQMARLFTDRGHRVHIVGIAPVAEEIRQKLPQDLPYAMTTLYEAHPPKARRLRGIKGRLNAPERRRQAARRAKMRAKAEQLNELFRAARPGAVVIVTQVWAMEWVALADTKGLTVIGMSHESFEASQKSTRGNRVRRYYPEVDRLLVLTPEDADLWIRAGMENVGSMPNPLPFMPDSPAPVRRRSSPASAASRSRRAWTCCSTRGPTPPRTIPTGSCGSTGRVWRSLRCGRTPPPSG